jgi:hypothetical protein
MPDDGDDGYNTATLRPQVKAQESAQGIKASFVSE